MMRLFFNKALLDMLDFENADAFAGDGFDVGHAGGAVVEHEIHVVNRGGGRKITLVELKHVGNVVDGEFKYPRLEDYEKFAELIIAELDKVLMDNHYNDPHEIPNFIEDVKKHFGVK